MSYECRGRIYPPAQVNTQHSTFNIQHSVGAGFIRPLAVLFVLFVLFVLPVLAHYFNISTEAFILAHRNDDVRTLALRSCQDPDIDLRAALEQIAGWQSARQKLPLWVETEGIVYPPHLSMEQCSSETAARYKATVAQRLTGDRELLVDLTGGLGVDFSYMAQGFKRAIYVERQEQLCRIAEHNFRVLGLNNATVMNVDAEDVLFTQHSTLNIQHSTLIFIDPARRDQAGRRTFAISDCTPNVLALKDSLLRISPTVMVKLSPMLDWRKAVADFSGAVSEVHIVAVGGECKELLLVLNRQDNAHCQVYCVNDSQLLTFNTADEVTTTTHNSQDGRINPAPTLITHNSQLITHNSHDGRINPTPTLTTHNSQLITHNSQDGRINPAPTLITHNSQLITHNSQDGRINPAPTLITHNSQLITHNSQLLLVPNAAVMKAGCFALLEHRYGVRQIGRNSHLFTSDTAPADFPGRVFAIDGISTMNRRELKALLSGVERANITTRNFPLTVAELRKRLHLNDGGTCYLFATTDSDNHHIIIKAHKPL